MTYCNLTHEFFKELKQETFNDDKITSLAKQLDINTKYRNIDALTLAIFYQHKEAFHILLERGINTNPPDYIDLPPLLWSLEVPDKYFFKHLITHTNVDLFHIEKTYGENIISNMCLKLNDIDLFQDTLNLLNDKDSIALRSLLMCRVSIDQNDLYPLEACLYSLNMNIEEGTSHFLENMAFQKIKYLNEYCNQNVNLFPEIFFMLLPSYKNIINKCTFFLKNIFEFINSKIDFTQFFRDNSKMVEQIISNKNNIVKYIFQYYEISETEKLKYLNLAVESFNIELVMHLLNRGCKISDIKSFSKLIYLVLNYDNLNLYIQMIEHDDIKYKIWTSPFTLVLYNEDSFLPGSVNLTIPKFHRTLHLACLHKSTKIIRYLINNLGDNLESPGLCDYSPQELIYECIGQGLLPESFYNEITAPLLTTDDFKKQDTLHQTECAICLEDFYNSSVTMLECGHAFHNHCLAKNKKSNNTCPMCRGKIKDKYQCNYNISYILPKRNDKKQCHLHCYTDIRHHTNKVCLPVTSKTHEDKDDFYQLDNTTLISVQDKAKKHLALVFKNNMEEYEKTIQLKELKLMLTKQKIGKRPKQYNKNGKSEFNNPPNTPIIKRRGRHIIPAKQIDVKNQVIPGDPTIRNNRTPLVI